MKINSSTPYESHTTAFEIAFLLQYNTDQKMHLNTNNRCDAESRAFVTSTCCISMVISLLVSIESLEYFTVPQHPQEIIDIKELDLS